MGITSLQVCMDSSDWLQGTIHEENGMDSSSPMSGDILTCSRPLIERRLRPPHDLALKCPRCESTHTKFCYYNNYSLSQPRYFCKTCRRYWTKGGTLRNIPVGGGCRKNKKVSTKKSNSTTSTEMNPVSSTTINNNNPTDLQLSFPEMPFPPHHHYTNFNHFGGNLNPSAFMLENPVPIHDFMENKYDLVGSSSRNQDFLGNGDNIGITGFGHEFNNAANFCSPFGMTSTTIDGNNFGNINMDASHMLPYQNHQNAAVHEDVKPNPKLLSLEWHHEQGCSDVGKESFGYLGAGLGSWTGLMNGYGSSATNPLV